MVTREEIAAQDENDWNDEARSLWLTLFRQYPGYSPTRFPDVAAKLAAVQGYDAKKLLAVLVKIEEIGSGTIKIEGGGEGLDFDQERDRNELIAFGLSVLYDTRAAVKLPFFTTAKGKGNWI